MSVKQYDTLPGVRARLVSPEDILSIPVSGATLVNDGDVVVINTDGKTVSAVAGSRQYPIWHYRASRGG